MAKIMLFGPYSSVGLPQEVIPWLQEYIAQGHEFLVGDSKGFDSSVHRLLSSLGALDKATIYCMDDPRSNVYDLKVKSFVTDFSEERKQAIIRAKDNSIEPFVIEKIEQAMDIPYNRQWYEFRDRQMIKDCDIAIGVWDGESKTVTNIIQLLNIYNKPCYTFSING